MATKPQTAAAFASLSRASCHNATTSGGIYKLHGHTIAVLTIHPAQTDPSGNLIPEKRRLQLSWCGYYTPTTASHLNCILDAVERHYGVFLFLQRLSYFSARRERMSTHVYHF